LGQIKSFVLISLGDLNQTICHPREVFKPAIVNSAHAIIILHNHPSGNPLPSQEDRAMTKIIMDAGKLLLIPVFDHVIAGDKGRFYSFKESQLQASAV
jgi:DNA repair protein RadC